MLLELLRLAKHSGAHAPLDTNSSTGTRMLHAEPVVLVEGCP